MNGFRSACALVLLGLLALGARGAEWKPGQPVLRYTGQWVDATWRTADKVGPWHETGSAPRLDDRELFASEQPIRWLIDNTLPAAMPGEPMVEFFGGDCLPGRVIAYHDGAQPGARPVAPHLEVATSQRLDGPNDRSQSSVRVTLPWLKRIVWQRVGPRYQPGTVFLLDGRQLDFRSVRFSAAGLRLLRRTGIQEVAWNEVAELHLPALDPWDAYFEQLAGLGLTPKARLVQVETSWGLRATSSTDRFRARAPAGADKPANWHHLVQPAWSLDPMWLPFESIRVRQYFLAHEVPLSRIEPAAARQQSDLGGPAWPWQTDRNVQWGPLESGGVESPWGFGVHGQTVLEFPLPTMARTFRTRLGLDQVAGSGGCVRAKVVWSAGGRSVGVKPLYASERIVGSKDSLDTGKLVLESGSAPASRLVLQVDSASGERPADADPLDIRTHFDWLEPIVELDPEKLEPEVLRRGPRQIPAWQSWKAVMGDAEAVRLVTHWDQSDKDDPGFRLATAIGHESLHLTGTVWVRPYKDQLVLAVSRPVGGPSKIEVRVDGEPLGQFDVPERSSRKNNPQPIVVSLGRFHGRQVAVEIVQESKNGRSLVEWEEIALVGRTFETDPGR